MGPEQLVCTVGGLMSAAALYRALERGEHPQLVAVDALDPVPLRLAGACRTRAPGVRIVYDDGATLVLTGGHTILVASDYFHHEHERFGCIRSDPYVCARDVRVGQIIHGRMVARVEHLGEIDAIRIWADRPEWIQTPAGPIGTRWHEIVTAWAVTGDVVDEYRGPLPVRSCGYVVGHWIPEALQWRACDEAYSLDEWHHPDRLGMVYNIERTLIETLQPLSRLSVEQHYDRLVDGDEVVARSSATPEDDARLLLRRAQRDTLAALRDLSNAIDCELDPPTVSAVEQQRRQQACAECTYRRVAVLSPAAAATPRGIEANVEYAKDALRDSLRRGEAPYSSHLLTQVLADDEVSAACAAWEAAADAVAVYVDHGISADMRVAIQALACREMPFEYRQLASIE